MPSDPPAGEIKRESNDVITGISLENNSGNYYVQAKIVWKKKSAFMQARREFIGEMRMQFRSLTHTFSKYKRKRNSLTIVIISEPSFTTNQIREWLVKMCAIQGDDKRSPMTLVIDGDSAYLDGE